MLENKICSRDEEDEWTEICIEKEIEFCEGSGGSRGSHNLLIQAEAHIKILVSGRINFMMTKNQKQRNIRKEKQT